MRRTIGVNTWVWTSPLDDDALAEIAAKAAGMGFGAIELPVEQPGDWSPDAAADVLAEHRLAARGDRRDGPGTQPRGRTRLGRRGHPELPRALPRRRRAARVAASSPGPFYAPRPGATWRMDAEEREARYRELRRNLAPVVRTAERSGIRLAIEPLNRYETSLVNTVEQALDALGPLLGPGLGLALDSYHLNIEEKDSAAAIRAAGDTSPTCRSAATTAARSATTTSTGPPSSTRSTMPGTPGSLGLESFTGENATIAVAASVWRPLASSGRSGRRSSLPHRAAGRAGTPMTDSPATHPVRLFVLEPGADAAGAASSRPRSGGGAASGGDRTIVPMRLDPNPPRPRPVRQPGRPERDLSRPLPSSSAGRCWRRSRQRSRSRRRGRPVLVDPGVVRRAQSVAFVAYGLDKRAAKRGARAPRSRPC